MKYLIVGLGNIGPEYALTRHNVGFMVLDQLALDHDVKFQPDRLASVAVCKYKGRTLCLIKPTTYMNLSGRAVSYWINKLKIPIEKSLIVVDDIALPFGKLRMRIKGSSAGHNGLKDIEAVLNTQDYPRLRIGIGSDFSKGNQANYVLEKFSEIEQKELQTHISQACKMIQDFCAIGIEQTMTKYNK